MASDLQFIQFLIIEETSQAISLVVRPLRDGPMQEEHKCKFYFLMEQNWVLYLHLKLALVEQYALNCPNRGHIA